MTRHEASKPAPRRANEAFKEAVHAWARRINVRPTQIRVQRMNRKWASCSPKGRVTFSVDLLETDRDFQEYVIVHELLHLRVPNHGRLFRSLLSAYLPDWEKRAASNESRRPVRRSDSHRGVIPL